MSARRATLGPPSQSLSPIKILVNDLPVHDAIYGTIGAAKLLSNFPFTFPRPICGNDTQGLLVRKLAVRRTLPSAYFMHLLHVLWSFRLAQSDTVRVLRVFLRIHILQVIRCIVESVAVFVVDDESLGPWSKKALSNKVVNHSWRFLPIWGEEIEDVVPFVARRAGFYFSDPMNTSIRTNDVARS